MSLAASLVLLAACKESSSTTTYVDAASPVQDSDAGADATVQAPDDAGDTALPDAGTDSHIDDLRLEFALEERAYECGVLSRYFGGGMRLDEANDDYGRCVIRCQLEVSCEDLFEAYCGEMPEATAAAACVATCEKDPADGFVCNDGTRIPHAFVCDLVSGDCAAGEDEGEHCEKYYCADGEVVPSYKINCDNTPDCADGSDEKDSCAFACVAFVCDGGEKRLEPGDVCDQHQDCVDNTDELNCKRGR